MLTLAKGAIKLQREMNHVDVGGEVIIVDKVSLCPGGNLSFRVKKTLSLRLPPPGAR